MCANKVTERNFENLEIHGDMSDAFKHICELSRDFYGHKNVSAVELANRSGIRDQLDDLNLKNVAAYLQAHPELIHFWLLRSADKRVPSGWYFKPESGKYVVGYYPRGEHLMFDDEHTACAEFVVREVRELIE